MQADLAVQGLDNQDPGPFKMQEAELEIQQEDLAEVELEIMERDLGEAELEVVS